MCRPGWIRVAALAVALASGAVESHAQGAPPPVCDALPGQFTPQRRALDQAHAQALALIIESRTVQADRTKRAAALIPSLERLLDATARRHGERSPEAGMLRADLAELLRVAHPQGPPQINQAAQRLREDALASLETATGLEPTEVWISVRSVFGGFKGLDYASSARLLLDRHRRVAGDVERAAPLWRNVVQAVRSDPSRWEAVAREQVAAAERSGSVRWLYDARATLLEVLVSAVPSDEPRPQGITPSIPEIRAFSRRAPEILAVARSLEPEMSRRAAWERSDAQRSCTWLSGFEWHAKAMMALGSAEEAAASFRRRVERAATPDSFATDFAGAIDNIAPILVARSIDRDLYRHAMAEVAGGAPGCPSAPTAPEVCSLTTAAGALASLSAPLNSAQLLRDAVEASERANLPGQSISDGLAKLAEVEWRFGTASEAPALLARLEKALGGAFETSEAGIAALRLRAQIADAQLDDARALADFERLVNLSITLSRRHPRHPNAGQSDQLAGAARDAARALVHAHVRRRFCADCAAPAPIAPIAIAWLEAVFDPQAPDSLAPTPEDYLLTAALPAAVWPAASAKRADERFRATLRLQNGSHGVGAMPVFEAVRRISRPRTPERTHLRITALAVSFADAMETSSIDRFMAFLSTRDLSQKRKLWRDYAEPVASNLYQQFGADIALYDTLDALARNALFNGFPEAGRVVFEYLVDTIEAGASNGTPQEMKGLQNAAPIVVGALGRLAAFAIDNREWALAHRLLDLAAALIRDRLDREWAVGSERAGASLRELRPAARLVAQLRTRLLTTPGAPVTRRDADVMLFQDLQVAMLSDTALASQASARRRVLSDAELAAAIRRRDTANAEIAGIDAIRPVYDHSSPVTADDLIANARKRLNAESAEVARRLPVAEDLVSPAPLSLTEAQRALSADEAILILHAGSDGVYGFLASPSRAAVTWMARIPVKELEARIGAVRAGVDVTGGTLPRFPFDEARALHDLLLGPARDALSGVAHLLVVADGPLQSLPLAVLPTGAPAMEPAAPDEIRAAGVPWLVSRHALTMLPSARALATRRTAGLRSTATLAFAGIGDPVLEGPPGHLRAVDFGGVYASSGVADVTALRKLAALPDTRVEVTRIGEVLKADAGDLLLGPAATEGAIKAKRLADYRVLLFATHGLVAGAVKGSTEPGLVLTPPATATPEDDGFLTASEIATLRLDADLVVLSACNTATSDGRPRAEGLSGLARAFLSAGARSVVATHWAIPSEAAVEVTTRAVAARSAEPDLDWGRAIQRAMVAVASEVGPPENAHPAHWGAFVVVGLPPQAPSNR